MIKEVFKQNFLPNKDLVFPFKSTKYLDIFTKPDDEGNLNFELKVN